MIWESPGVAMSLLSTFTIKFHINKTYCGNAVGRGGMRSYSKLSDPSYIFSYFSLYVTDVYVLSEFTTTLIVFCH